MGLRGIAILLIALVCFVAVPAHAQSQPPSEQLVLSGKSATTWTEGRSDVVLLHGPVRITLDRATLTADDAVVWLAPASQENLAVQDVQFSLVGHATLDHAGVTRSGPELFVTGQVRSEKIRIVADERMARDDSNTDLFKRAAALRKTEQPAVVAVPVGPSTTQSSGVRTPPRNATRPTAGPAIEMPVVFEADNVETINGDDGNVVVVLKGGVRLMQKRPLDRVIELSAQNAVLFTSLKSLKELQQSSGGKKQGRDIIIAAYLEDDVRIDFVSNRKGAPEQRLTAGRVYYEFATDRAVLTDAIMHTTNPQSGWPVVMRGKLIRQLAQGEYTSEHAKLSNSTFAVPSYCIAAERLYMHTTPSGDPLVGDIMTYDATNLTFAAFDLPFFFLPHSAGDMSQHGFVLRGVGFGQDSDFGWVTETNWGLFETLGQIPPRDLDVSYRLDDFTLRGPALGLNAKYDGGNVTDTTKQAWDFDGQFQSYLIYDTGVDDVGRYPVRGGDPPSLRGQLLWEHQHFFPDGWQAQARIGYVSDPTFMEQWFRRDFETGPPRDIMGYLKHQQDNEAFTFGATWQPDRYVTTSDFQQEQFEVDRLPEVGYYREGDSLLSDHLTLFSENQAAGLHYATSRATPADQSFNLNPASAFYPGLPAQGYTGITGQVVWRGDFRQQLDWPFTVGPLRIDPYVMGRYTEYSDSPQGNQRSRVMAGAGTRITTELWKVDPSAQSDLLDIHQLRNVIEPEANFFTSAMNVQRNQVYVYDQQIDAINDVSAAQFALHDRWETKRGGPGQWRNVDLLSLDVEVDYFANKPSKKFNLPNSFRGVFFSAYPEESVPRDAVNGDLAWRLSDNTVVLGELAYNLDRGSLQTLGIGLLVRRDEKLSYFVGNRYVDALSSNITSIHVDYEFTYKYILDADQEFDFTQGKNVVSSVAILRRFDTFIIALRYNEDETTKQTGFSFNFYPIGLGAGLDTSALNTFRR